MSVLVVPDLEREPWPTLGPQIVKHIEQNLIFGPGDLRGKPAIVDADKRALIYRAYEIFPQGHPQAGRRRFQRVVFSLRKGLAKTELAAWLTACELHHAGPVRCDGFDAAGEPVGRPVVDPYIPLIAYTEEQTEELAYGALVVMLSEGPLVNDFDIGLERIIRITGDGRAVALAGSPDARDGARTTFQHFDETHRFTLPRLKAAHRTMLANLPKRRLSDAWGLETTTAFETGAGSVAEEAMVYARSIAAGEIENPRMFFFHRQASDELDFDDPAQLRRGLVEASGGDEEWLNIDAVVAQFDDPTADRLLLERLWGNRPVSGGGRAFPIPRWRELVREFAPADGALITLGFDGSRFHDATGIIGTDVETGFQWVAGVWAPPNRTGAKAPEAVEWEVPQLEVNSVVDAAFERWDVWRMYADPYWFESWLAEWQGRYGDKRVIEWRTNRLIQMAYANRAYHTAIVNGDVGHDGDPTFEKHIANACRQPTNYRDPDTGEKMWLIRKERPDSPFKMDLAMAAILSWEARTDCIASGATNESEVGVMWA